MSKLSGHTKPFAVLGHPIGHTLSPIMHNAALEALDIDGVYLAFDVHPDHLLSVLESMGTMGFVGVNLTVPHKEIALSGLSSLDDSAQLMGAANTVKFTADGTIGYNTDGYGFLKAMEEAFGMTVEGQTIFVLGTGGAGRSVALISAQAGASSLTLADLDPERTQRVAEEIHAVNPSTKVRTVTQGSEHADAARQADIVVHATPVGMQAGDASLLDPEAFHDGQCVFDLIYHIPKTPIMLSAAQSGARTTNGLGMLLHQGARALTLWTDREAPISIMRQTLETAVYAR